MASVLLLVLLGLLLYGILFFSYRRFFVFQKQLHADPDLTLLLIVRNQAPIIEGVIKNFFPITTLHPNPLNWLFSMMPLQMIHRRSCAVCRANTTAILVFGQTPGVLCHGKSSLHLPGKGNPFFLLTERVGL